YSRPLTLPYSSIPILFSLNAPAPPEIYTLSLHDALPIWRAVRLVVRRRPETHDRVQDGRRDDGEDDDADRHDEPEDEVDAPGLLDRKSTRLNSSHVAISYAVFCLKKKKKK